MTDLDRFKKIAKELQAESSEALFAFWAKHQNGRNANALGMRKRGLVQDLANFAANIGTAKKTTGDTRKMYQKIAHGIYTDALKRKGNPTMARKKTRTAKQRAATRKMLAANKARRGKKTKTARRKTRGRKTATRKTRRNPQKARPGLKAKKKLYVAFICWPKGKVNYAYIADTRAARVGISGSKSQSVLFQTKARAHNVAKLLAKTWPGARAGVANADATTAEIRAACLGKA